MDKDCEEIFGEGKGLHSFRPDVKMGPNWEKRLVLTFYYYFRKIFSRFQENILQQGIAIHKCLVFQLTQS